MDLKVAVVIVCLCILAITSSEAAIPKCCVKTRTTISINVLRNVVKWFPSYMSGIGQVLDLAFTGGYTSSCSMMPSLPCQ
ncbi:C-C motif chemokine 25-like protein [Lates japonicus]|uniref:C-C motif chemokine 25-like protein n=1 Tax=Lates japonicus TaxID=270547 RepID=A0AAD3MHZ3_LATJO|nr:C-C motif chemokine 25-like protein [Lates japonicus]